MATAREFLTEVLTPLGYPIVPSRLPEQIAKTTLSLGTASVEPSGFARQRRWFMDIYILTQLQEPAAADDALDDALGKVLDALDKAQPLNWTGAERGTADESFNSFKVTVWILMEG